MNKRILAIGCILAGISVILGAFGAHALGDQLTQAQHKTYQTGIEYHFIHSIALCILALSSKYLSPNQLKFIEILFGTGILFFSGSLYLLACKNILGIESWKWLGPITPIGGVCFILAWLGFGFSVYQSK